MVFAIAELRESFRIAACGYKHMHTIMKLISHIFSVCRYLVYFRANMSYRPPSSLLSLVLIYKFAHLPSGCSVLLNLSIARIILYNIYVTLLQLKLEIGNVQLIKKFFNSGSSDGAGAGSTLICNPFYLSMGVLHHCYDEQH